MTASSVRLLLTIFLIAMYILAVFYLRRRGLSNGAYTFWGIFALLLPVFGPFLVIAIQPGHSSNRPARRTRRIS
jgi:hypothetical protein